MATAFYLPACRFRFRNFSSNLSNAFKYNFHLPLILTLFAFFPTKLWSQDSAAYLKGGWAIQLGAGYIYGGNIGITGENQILLKEKCRITPFVATGISEGGTDSTSSSYLWYGAVTGANMELGKKHRFIFGPQFVFEQIIGSSIEIKKEQLYTASFIIGYKGTARFGLIWQIYIGDVYLQDPYSESKSFSHSSHVGLGLGYKF